jgi:hypothetical protein
MQPSWVAVGPVLVGRPTGQHIDPPLIDSYPKLNPSLERLNTHVDWITAEPTERAGPAEAAAVAGQLESHVP